MCAPSLLLPCRLHSPACVITFKGTHTHTHTHAHTRTPTYYASSCFPTHKQSNRHEHFEITGRVGVMWVWIIWGHGARVTMGHIHMHTLAYCCFLPFFAPMRLDIGGMHYFGRPVTPDTTHAGQCMFGVRCRVLVAVADVSRTRHVSMSCSPPSIHTPIVWVSRRTQPRN
jgi:hypothetical protein